MLCLMSLIVYSLIALAFEAVDYIDRVIDVVHQSDTIYFRVVDNEVEIMTIIGMQDL